MKNVQNLTNYSRAISFGKVLGHDLFIIMLLLLPLISGCDKSPEEQLANSVEEQLATAKIEIPQFPSDPGDFVVGISNPYLGFTPGKIFHYIDETDEGIETIDVEVTNDAKVILGVNMTVLHDQVFLDGTLIEDTFDWIAEDSDGNVWYFGEDSKEYENGVLVSTEGSWEAGVDGALPGIYMLAEPHNGMQYQQEFAVGVAEDMAKIVGLNKTVNIELGTFTGCLNVKEWNPLNQQGSHENKFYKPGLGLVLEVHPSGGMHTVELVGVE
jgi:hypothetical protein